MPLLHIIQHKSKLMPALPHHILINDQLIGITKLPEVTLKMPAGTFKITIQSMFPFIFASTLVHLQDGLEHYMVYKDREKWWDILFVVDIILWCADFFFTLPHPYNVIYQIFTNGYLVLWLLYEWLIRKKYFKIEQYDKPAPPEEVSEGAAE
ncbi:MAG: hypothetical protein IKR71_10315 [Bacteroidales bacterium]|nr:hypothetical protein [Bacteroidales bacterium]